MLGYSYIDLSAPEQDARRLALDSLGHYTILSQLAILILASSYQFLFCPWRPRVQSAFLRKLEWRLMTPLSWSSRESKSLADWGVMWGWFGWMFWLVVREAGNDYLHLTKAFGMAAAASLPMHIVLSMKRTPLRYIFDVSYEGEINHMHQGLGKIINLLLSAHAVLYLKFFWDTSRMKTRLLEFDILCGVVGFIFLNIMVTASYPWVRRSYYRVFYILHITISPILFPLLFLHVSYLRPYLLASLAFFIYDRLHRVLTRVQTTATIRRLSSDILHLSIDLRQPVSAPRRPVSHMLLTVPGISPWTSNPFTIADFSREAGGIQIVARIRNGATKRLAFMSASRYDEIKIPVVVEINYGTCIHYRGLHSQFDRILIVAGGVGGSFAIPWIKHLASIPDVLVRTRFIWAMRDVATLSWAVSTSTAANVVKEKAEVFLTSTAPNQEETDEGVEMQETHLLSGGHDRGETVAELEKLGVRKERVVLGRPDLDVLLKGTAKGGSVAVLVCGPWELGAGMRRAAAARVKRGKRVWVHVEEFGS